MSGKRLQQIPLRYEPGEELPSREHIDALYMQRHVVDVLRWILENDAWLRTCELKIVYEDYWIEPRESLFNWTQQPSAHTKELARQSVYKILPELFDSIRHPESEIMPDVSKWMIRELNAVKWNPDQAITTLAKLTPGIDADDAEDWLKRHKADWKAAYLDRNAKSAASARQQPSPRL